MLLSIIIPTKDRYGYLRECLKELTKIESNDLEIVVQDNTIKNLEILEFIEELSDERIKYYHSLENLTQTTNSDTACNHANGDYVCYIGDDDCVCNRIMDVVKYLKINKIEACLCDVASFYWKDCVFAGKEKARLSFWKRKFEIDEICVKEKLYLNYS